MPVTTEGLKIFTSCPHFVVPFGHGGKTKTNKQKTWVQELTVKICIISCNLVLIIVII